MPRNISFSMTEPQFLDGSKTVTRRGPLSAITADDCAREGFPGMTPQEFIAFFCQGHAGCTPESIVTRIEFAHVEPKGGE